MKHPILFAAALSLLLSGTAAAQSNTVPTPAQLEADAVVIRYFDALVQGDTATVLSLLGGRLLERRQLLLSNPSYSVHLVNHYKDAQFQITGHSITGESQVAVDATITINRHESLKTRFLLRRETHPSDVTPRFYVVEESEPGGGPH